MPRSSKEILDRVKYMRKFDFTGEAMSDLIEALPWGDAKKFFNDGFVEQVDTGEKTFVQQNCDPESLKQTIIGYLPFAWDKANHCRGLSAMRSLTHMANWFWLMGDDNMAALALSDYTHYGKRHLVIFSEAVGFDWKTADDGKWRNGEEDEGISAAEAMGTDA